MQPQPACGWHQCRFPSPGDVSTANVFTRCSHGTDFKSVSPTPGNARSSNPHLVTNALLSRDKAFIFH
eukprot:2508109-Rhodomonas_salina.3